MVERRDVDTILVVHKMDPDRRTLYVEGRRDTVFLRWLLGTDLDINAMVVEIDEVESPETLLSNNRARVVHFASKVQGHNANIQCFIDADYHRIFGQNNLTANVTLTDYRDLEGYLLGVECFEKLLRLGLNDLETDPEEMILSLCQVCRECAYIRIASEKLELGLAFQKTDIKKYLTCKKLTINLASDKFIRALFQNSSNSLKGVENFNREIAIIREEHQNVADVEIVHGKDLLATLDKLLTQWKGDDIQPSSTLLWTVFERRMASNFVNLSRVVTFLEGH